MFVVPATRPASGQQSLVTAVDSAVTSPLWSNPVFFGNHFNVPAAFVAGNWTLTDPVTDGDLTISLSQLPASDSTVTDVEYRVDGGAWVATGDTVGPITISGLTNTQSYDVELRAVSRHGAGQVGDLKSATPTV